MKKCNKCELEKPRSNYTPDKRNKDGLQSICNDCRRAYKIAARQLRMQGIGVQPVSEKTCNKCGETKISEDFFRDSGIADGRSTICKECKGENVVKWRSKKREEYNEYMRVYRKRHPVKYEKERGRGLKLRYNITMEVYAQMLASQNGVCAICLNPPNGERPLFVDHHHATGKVRQLLCASCNRSIAIFDDNVLFPRAQEYINRHKD